MPSLIEFSQGKLNESICSRQASLDTSPPNSNVFSSSSHGIDNDTTEFKLFVSNVHGLRTKSQLVFRNSSVMEVDVYSLTETWLKEEISSSEYFGAEFNVFRKDRWETGSDFARGGGVLIAVRNQFSSSRLPIPNSIEIECICVKICINSNMDVYIYNAYLPKPSLELFNKHLAAIESMHSHCRSSDIFIVTGDFNIPNAKWTKQEEDSNIMLPEEIHPDYAAEFISGVNNLGLYQVNNVFNHMHRLLNLVFTNDPINLDVAQPEPLVNYENYHPPILATFE